MAYDGVDLGGWVGGLCCEYVRALVAVMDSCVTCDVEGLVGKAWQKNKSID